MSAALLPVPRVAGVLAACVGELLGKLRRRLPFLDREKARELLASWGVPTDKACAYLEWTPLTPLESGLVRVYGW